MTMDDKVLCPWCGDEMVSVSYHMEGTHGYKAHYACNKCGAKSPWFAAGQIETAEQAAITAAKIRRQELNRVLKVEDIIKMPTPWSLNTPPYFALERLTYPLCWMSFSSLTEIIDGSFRSSIGDRSEYGKTWRCWLRKPTEEEIASAPWGGDEDETES